MTLNEAEADVRMNPYLRKTAPVRAETPPVLIRFQLNDMYPQKDGKRAAYL